jgi:hypothetical protein
MIDGFKFRVQALACLPLPKRADGKLKHEL